MPAVMLSEAASAASMFSGIATQMTNAVGEIIPIALGVAAAILVPTLGYKLFKKFTKG